MIKKNDKEIVGVFKGTTEISAVYKGLVLVYQNAKTMIAEGVPPITVLNALAKVLLGYRVYGNSIQDGTPTPDTPIEIQSVGDKTNNLLKNPNQLTLGEPSNTQYEYTSRKWTPDTYVKGISLSNNYNPNVCSLTIEDNKYIMSWEQTSQSAYGIGFPIVGLEAGETYSVSFEKEGTGYGGLLFYNANGELLGYSSNASRFKVPANIVYCVLLFNGNSYSTNLKVWNIQVKKGPATNYEPYGYRIPIKKASSNLLPYPYIFNSGTYGGIDITINDDGSIKLNGTTTGLNITFNTFRLKAGTYTISGNPSPDVNLWLRVVGGMSSAYYVRNYNGIKGTLTIAEDSDMYVYITISTGVTVDNVTIYPMVNEGTMDLEYSKYFTPVTTNIYLEEPLRKIGDGIPSRLPEGYTPLGYIETASDPSRSFITTDIPLNTISYIEFEYKLLNTASQHPMVFSSYTSSSIQSVAPYICVDGGANGSWTITPKINKSSQEKTKYMITNNNTSTNLLKIGGWYDNYWTAKGRYYYVKIYDKNNKLIRYFVPCKNSNNVVGMYDTVNNIFYKSAGTEEFIAGNIMYADYIDFETQKVYRNLKKINLSTTLSDFSFYTGWDNEDYTTCFFNASDKIVGFSGIMSNYFKSGTDYHANVYDNQITGNYGNRYIYIKIAKTIATSKTELNNWLNTLSTPVEIIYQLASTTEESIELPDILLNKGTNVVDVETSIAPSNLWIKYKGKE